MTFVEKGTRVIHPNYGSGTVIGPSTLTDALLDMNVVVFDNEKHGTSMFRVSCHNLERA